MGIADTLKFIMRHPLNRNRKAVAIKRFIMWQIGSRLVPGPVVLNFANDAKLLAAPGMTGATGNIYAGLHEFEEMAFVLHYLRGADLFVDVGANIGSYTVLASAGAGARSIAFEPLPETFRHLVRNICLNDVRASVQAHNMGIGREPGILRFTRRLDTVNHVASGAEIDSTDTVEVKVATLDSMLVDEHPSLIKIDVEGFEANVVAGARETLAGAGLDAVIMELNGSGRRYGFEDNDVHRQMLDLGFDSFVYAPFERRLHSLHGKLSGNGNTLYVKNVDAVAERLALSAAFSVNGMRI
jgi:FkbM family methyltransferase